MTAPTMAPHPCNPDPFAICECGRPGVKTFGRNPLPHLAQSIEMTFEFVEDRSDAEVFTQADIIKVIWPVVGTFRSYWPGGAIAKTLRIMEHHGMVERVERSPFGKGRPIRWRRALPLGAAS